VKYKDLIVILIKQQLLEQSKTDWLKDEGCIVFFLRWNNASVVEALQGRSNSRKRRDIGPSAVFIDKQPTYESYSMCDVNK
jgi:hypothetical protein